MTIAIRTAREDEQDTLEALKRRAALANPGDREVLTAHPEAFEILSAPFGEGHVFIAEADGAIAGFASIRRLDDNAFELEDLFVEPEAWKEGIGRALADHSAEIARQEGAKELKVVGNPHAEGFYEACGFRQIGRVQLTFGHGLILTRALTETGSET